MAPRGQTLPQAATESAREARKSFFCELCQKGYARMNDYEAHEGSYDHQHRKRLKEMKQLTKDPNAISKAERERKANEEAGLKSINLSLSSGGTGGSTTKKKPVFKSTLQPHNAAAIGQTAALPTASAKDDVVMLDSSNDDEAWLRECVKLAAEPAQPSTSDRYDPRVPSRLNPCPFPQCEEEPCKHANSLPTRDPRRTLEGLLRARGLPTKEPNESWETFGRRRMADNVRELQAKGMKVHDHILADVEARGGGEGLSING
ncbi:hypothetical protein LTR36_006602 [Oleoguttula mirabilis]|uniref:C2H2-type domain-containing protein n=1 Tax=Oleoguttula mirabilis TaxID=1507867 RepID=A0AAV9JBJ0_9PEZI|nr:hypothetical protein LTR36_006602 [Oleoguttula mirabilis]